MNRQNNDDLFGEWRGARAFVVDDMVCGSFSLPSPEDLVDAEAAEAEGHCPAFDPGAAFYIYGEHGLKREYYVDRRMMEGAEHYGQGCKVLYSDGKTLAIEPLFVKGEENGPG